MKLRGRAEAPDWSRGCTLSSSTRGDTTDVHGPLQRLLDRNDPITWTTITGPSRTSTSNSQVSRSVGHMSLGSRSVSP